MMQLDPPVPLTSGSRSRNTRRVEAMAPRQEQRSCHARSADITAPEAVTRDLERICLQDCGNRRGGLTKVEDSPAGLLPQQRKLYRIQDDVKVLQLAYERHAPLLQGVVHHRIPCRTGKEDHTVL